MPYESIPEYRPPRGGEWILLDPEPFDGESGVKDLSVLSSLDAPAHRLNDLLMDPDSDLSDFEATPLQPGETRADRIHSIGQELLTLLLSRS